MAQPELLLQDFLTVPENNLRGKEYYSTSSTVHQFQDMFKHTTDKFDWSERRDCCNVISICLYIIKNKDQFHILRSLRKYLLSIERSIKNIQVNLPLWVVRLYFGSSVKESIDVFDVLKPNSELYDKAQEILRAYEFITTHEQVELYVIPEEGLSSPDKIRTARFVPLYDPKVNVCIVREADGTVTNLDCQNILFFLNSQQHLFYLPDYGKINRFKTYTNEYQEVEDPYLFSGYSGWLVVYKSVLRRDFFSENQNLYDLLAGLFGTKLKIRPYFYETTFKELTDKINQLETDPSSLEPSSLSGAGDRPHEICSKVVLQNGAIFYLSYDEFISQCKRFNFIDALRLGFDEILLLDLFKHVISVHLPPESLTLIEIPSFDKKKADKKALSISITVQTESFRKLTEIKRLIIGDEIHTIQFGKYERSTNVYGGVTTLLFGRIVPHPVSQSELKKLEDMSKFNYNIFNLLYFIDSLLRGIHEEPFEIEVICPYDGRDLIYKSNILLNTPYEPVYDRFYDVVSIEKKLGGKRHKKYKYKSYNIKLSHKKRRIRTKKRQNRNKSRVKKK